MKIKGITIWEQYVEFFVLAIAAVVFVGFTAMQFIGDPNKITKGAESYSPGDVDQTLLSEANRVSAGLEPEARSPVQFPDHDPVLPKFESVLSSSISPEPTLPRLFAYYTLPDADELTEAGKRYVEPDIAAPYQLVVKQSFDALLPEAVDQYAELQARFPDEPYDIQWLTVAARFNVADVLALYQTDGENGELPFFESWYDGHIDILDVILEREERQNGEWGNLTVLKPIPGQYTFRDQIEGDVNVEVKDRILSELSNPLVQNAVIRPDFLPTQGSWLPPDPVEIVDDDEPDEILTPEMQEQRRLEGNLHNLKARYARVSKQVEDLGGELEQSSNAPGGSSSGGGGSGGGGGIGDFGSGPAGDRGAATDNNAANEKKRIRLTKAKRKLEKDIVKLEDRLGNLGVKLQADVQVEEEEFPDEITVWAHDMTIESGKVYRYRLSISVYNPVFAKKLHLLDDQHDRADQITFSSAKSPWTKPEVADEWLKLFVVGASKPDRSQNQQRTLGGLRLGDARADVFRFQYGRWWRGSFSIEPGDRIGGIRSQRLNDEESLEVDFNTDWFLLDVITEIDADREDRDRGYAASVLIQNTRDPELIVQRFPRIEANTRNRKQLLQDVELAELASEEVAAAGTN